MRKLRFDWDESKNRANRRKHKVSFEEAMTVFYDEHALYMDDPDHSDEEDRFLLLGLSTKARELVVSHCYRKSDAVVRIISAWTAEPAERQTYWSRMQ